MHAFGRAVTYDGLACCAPCRNLGVLAWSGSGVVSQGEVQLRDVIDCRCRPLSWPDLFDSHDLLGLTVVVVPGVAGSSPVDHPMSFSRSEAPSAQADGASFCSWVMSWSGTPGTARIGC
jgi:hypothetical protein